jgi:FkbH-like protein
MRTYSSKNFYFASCRFSSEAIKIIGNSLVNIIRQIVGKPRKLIAIDCDNTLWGGVVGETGFKNIILGSDGIGKVFTEVQKIIKHYVELGLVLTLVSKNNEQDVWEVFDNNSSMVLAKNDISLAKINWKSKVDNLIAISKELNLSLDSFIFIDDNKFERDEIRLRLPEVEVIDLPSEITDWPKELLNIRNVIQFSTSSEDRNKTYHYTIRQKFLNDISAHNDRIMFLRQVAMKPSLVPIDDHNIDRAAQISQRTNQFNLRTQRYTTSDIKKFASENNSFLVNLIDNYGDHGNIALIILRDLTPDILFVEAFMISCRVLSRDLEFWILNEIVKLSKAKKIKYIYFELKKTKKNQPVLDFFSNLGLSLLQPTELFKAQDLLLKSNILIEDSLYELNVEQFLVPRLEVFDE